MAFLDKLKSGLSKTKNAIFGQIDEVLKAFVKVDEDLLEELEELLIMSDVGVNATEEIMERLREDVKSGRLKEKEQVTDALKAILEDMIGEGEALNLSTTPAVILVIGVNGAGKTTTISMLSTVLLPTEGRILLDGSILDRRAHDGTERYFNHKIHFATDEFYGVKSSNDRALRLAKFWESYFEFVGGLYYRWGLPEEQEKFFRGNAIELRKIFMGK